MIDKYELMYGGAILADKKHENLFTELMSMPGMQTIPGGSALNTIRCTNFLLNAAGQERACLYFGSIGNDVEIGKRLSSGVEEEKLNANFSIDEETNTGKCGVVIHDRERALCADLGAAMKYKTEHMKENIHLASNAKILYTTGFFISSNVEALMLIAKFANENNRPFAINLSATFLIAGYTKEFLEIISYADFVFGNEDEFKCWGETHKYGTTDLSQITAKIAAIEKINHDRPRVVVCTQGKLPTLVSSHDFFTEQTMTKEFPVTLIPAEQVVDLNGAGDAFVGGFMAEYVRGKKLGDCIIGGQWMSSYIIQVSGTSFPNPCTYYSS